MRLVMELRVIRVPHIKRFDYRVEGHRHPLDTVVGYA